VERYQVAVTPDLTPSCSGSVSPNMSYTCSGLSPDTDYTITVSAINCGDQEGENNTFSVQPQGLGTYNIAMCFTVALVVLEVWWKIWWDGGSGVWCPCGVVVAWWGGGLVG
jgi:hypothetical protein